MDARKVNRPFVYQGCPARKGDTVIRGLSLHTPQRFSGGRRVSTGVFGAMMVIDLVNDGPVTIFIDSKNRE
ncbi:MAG: D-aminoacyl-tRNA deacylase [Bacteroidales bacterium]|nr:D-aminoacyl-tRNA deacylase [Bacteroidales bacterium]